MELNLWGQTAFIFGRLRARRAHFVDLIKHLKNSVDQIDKRIDSLKELKKQMDEAEEQERALSRSLGQKNTEARRLSDEVTSMKKKRLTCLLDEDEDSKLSHRLSVESGKSNRLSMYNLDYDSDDDPSYRITGEYPLPPNSSVAEVKPDA